MDTTDALEQKYALLFPHLTERQQHLVAAADAEQLGRGGIALVARLCGFSRPTIYQALKDLRSDPLPVDRIRRPGGGRKRQVEQDRHLLRALERLIDPSSRGDPMSPLRWTCKSTRQLSQALAGQGHPASHELVAQLLQQLGYSLQANAKTKEGKQHPDRDAQFRYVQRRAKHFQACGWPVISVDTKKKELVGNYKNAGREWQPVGRPEEVNVPDFPDKKLVKTIPYGVYDVQANEAWVSLGQDHDAAAFAVETIRRW
jgi:transposase